MKKEKPPKPDRPTEYLIVDDLLSSSPTCLGCKKLIRRGERYRVNEKSEIYGIYYKNNNYQDGHSPWLHFIDKKNIDIKTHILTDKKRLKTKLAGYVCSEQCLEYYKLLQC